MNEPQPGSHRFHAGRKRLPGEQPGPLSLLHAGHRGADGRARRAADLPGGRTDLADGSLRLPAAGLGQPPADLLRAARLPEPGGLLPAGVARRSPRTRNLVFAPHVYTYAFTLEQDLLGLPATPGGFPPNFTFGYQTAEAEAQAMHSAVFVTEFGDASSTDATILANEMAAQESTQTGGTLWAWKGLSGDHRVTAGASAGSIRTTRPRPMARPARETPSRRRPRTTSSSRAGSGS